MIDRVENVAIQAPIAKLFASEIMNRITAAALQICGGYGFTKECDLERCCRDARVFTLCEGASEIQRVVTSDSIFRDKRAVTASRPSS